MKKSKSISLKRILLLLLVAAILKGVYWSVESDPLAFSRFVKQYKRNMAVSQNEYLTYDKAVFARVLESGEIDFLDDPLYFRGEPVHFALMNVGKFKKDEEGLNWVDLDLKVVNPDGDTVMLKEGLLGKGGHLELENDTAPSPSGVYIPSRKVITGIYKVYLTIYDRIGGESVSDSGTFRLR